MTDMLNMNVEEQRGTRKEHNLLKTKQTGRKLLGSKQKINTNYRGSTQIGEQAQEDGTLREHFEYDSLKHNQSHPGTMTLLCDTVTHSQTGVDE